MHKSHQDSLRDVKGRLRKLEKRQKELRKMSKVATDYSKVRRKNKSVTGFSTDTELIFLTRLLHSSRPRGLSMRMTVAFWESPGTT